jgi:hypothetical protein
MLVFAAIVPRLCLSGRGVFDLVDGVRDRASDLPAGGPDDSSGVGGAFGGEGPLCPRGSATRSRGERSDQAAG